MENPADRWRQERVKAMTSPDRDIASAVEAACGSPLVAKTRIVEGFSNEVYVADTAAGQRVIVRIHWYESPHFEAEGWALARCAERQLPTPRVLLVRHDLPGAQPRSVCVESWLPGETLRSALTRGSLGPSDVRPILVAAGAFLARLHRIPTTGFGRIDAMGVAPETTWDAYRERVPLDQTYHAARSLGLPTSDIDDAVRRLRTIAPLWYGVAPRLLHGDFTPQNVMVEAGQLSGVIDFEFPLSGDPAQELAYWDYYRSSPFHNPTGASLPTEWLLEGYNQSAPPDTTLARRLVGCRVQLGLDLLNYHGVRDDQDPRFLAFIRAGFVRDLADLRGMVDGRLA